MQLAFNSSYAKARAAFLDAAGAAQARRFATKLPQRGRDGEDLTIDVAIVGDTGAPRRMLVTSGCHGIEGYCGSGLQIAALQDRRLLAQALKTGVSLVFVHALNPFGFSHGRRWTQENVDLNRNFQDFSGELPINSAYADFHQHLVSEVCPLDSVDDPVLQLIARRGLPYAGMALQGGQYAFADGLFFGGREPTWSNLATRALMREHLRGASSIGWIDIHTGLGPSGHGERMFYEGGGDLERARRWWSNGGRTPLTRVEDGTSSSAPLTGLIQNACRQECPSSDLTMITLEYGTVAPLEVLHALRTEHWLWRHPGTDEATRRRIQQQCFAAFFVDTPQWRAAVLEQGIEAIAQGVLGLASDR